MPYTDIEARRKNQREWVARKRARVKAETEEALNKFKEGEQNV